MKKLLIAVAALVVVLVAAAVAIPFFIPVSVYKGQIETFVLEEPVIVLEIDKQGRGNWVFDAKGAAPAGSPPAAGGSSSASAPGDIRLGEVKLKDGRITFIDARTGEKQEVTAINAT